MESETSAPSLDSREATWTSWPGAPPNDFARMIPDSDQAKDAFRKQVQLLAERRHLGRPAYSDRFIYYEETALENVVSSSSEPSHSEMESFCAAETPTDLPSVTGYYRLSMCDNPPQNHGIGWRLGCGRKGIDVEFVLAERTYASLRGIHARLQRSIGSGYLLAISDGHTFYADGTRLRRRRPTSKQALGEQEQPLQEYQKVLTAFSTLHLGDLVYRLEMQTLPPGIDQQQLKEVWHKSDESGLAPTFFLTPTPRQDEDKIEVRKYALTPAFSAGASATVYYAAYIPSGKVFAVKKLTVCNTAVHALLQNETTILAQYAHDHMCKLEDYFQPCFDHQAGTFPKTMVMEVFLVLSPALKHNLRQFSQNSAWLDAGELNPRHRSATILLTQIGSACEYLHDQGVMHRDIKSDNIGVNGDSIESLHFCLLDFGHAKVCKLSEDHSKGTTRYLAPEIVALKHKRRDTGPYTNSIDVWALGLASIELSHHISLLNVGHSASVAGDVRRKAERHEQLGLSGLLEALQADMVQEDPDNRIDMRRVVDRARGALGPVAETTMATTAEAVIGAA